MTKQYAQKLRPLDAPHFTYWQALYHSFFNPELYVDVGKRWKGLSIVYLLIVIFIGCIPVSLRLLVIFDNFYHQDVILPLKQLPVLYVQNGEVRLDKPMPYLVKNSSNEVVAIIDTSGTITEFSKKFPKASILITKNRLFYRFATPPKFFHNYNPNPGPVTTEVFSKNLNQVFDADEWVKSTSLKTIKILFNSMVYPTLALFFFTSYLVLLLAFALMAQLVAKILLEQTLTYIQSYRLLSVSATPHILVLFIVISLDWTFVGIGVFLMILLAGYFSFAVLSLRRASRTLMRR